MKVWDSNSFEAESLMALMGGSDQPVYVYEIAARMNHSCITNTIRGFTKDASPQIVFQALYRLCGSLWKRPSTPSGTLGQIWLHLSLQGLCQQPYYSE